MSLDKKNEIIPTLDGFDQHIGKAADLLGPAGNFRFSGNYGITELQDDMDATKLSLIQEAVLNADLNHAYERRDILKARLVLHTAGFIRIMKFHAEVLGQGRKLPKIPNLKTKHLAMLQICNLVIEIWRAVNALPPGALPSPLTLLGGFSLALYEADVAALTTAYETIIQKQREASTLRKDRDALLKNKIRPSLTEYRVRIAVLFPKGHSMIATLPLVYSRGGARAKPVQMTAEWDEELLKAVLNWTPNLQEELKHYSIRACNGPRYLTANEYTVATVEKDQTTYQTDAGLVADGSTLSYKVYTVTKAGRERGSNAVKVVREAVAETVGG